MRAAAQRAAIGSYRTPTVRSFTSTPLSRGDYASTIPQLGVKHDARVLVQGTGKASAFHNQIALDFGTKIEGFVTPRKGGTQFLERPVYETVKEAVEILKPDVTAVFVPPKLAADAIIDAIEAEIPLIVAVAEGVPVHDQMKVMSVLKTQSKSRLVGANCPGMINPRGCKLGIQPAAVHKPGKIGIAARSGTLSYEAAGQMAAAGLGQSYVFGLGGDPFPGTRTWEALSFLLDDPSTEGIILIGEIGGIAEEEAAKFLQGLPSDHPGRKKPIIGFIAGRGAPQGRTMGHAGAVWTDGLQGADAKIKAWERVGIRMVGNPGELGAAVLEEMSRQR